MEAAAGLQSSAIICSANDTHINKMKCKFPIVQGKKEAAQEENKKEEEEVEKAPCVTVHNSHDKSSEVAGANAVQKLHQVDQSVHSVNPH